VRAACGARGTATRRARSGAKLFDANGALASDDARALFTRFGAAFTTWVARHAAK
jgi:hypothetical protein